jgi:hypothetical protein
VLRLRDELPRRREEDKMIVSLVSSLLRPFAVHPNDLRRNQFKPTGQKRKMVEVAVYTVAKGKIVHEEFLYGAG